MKYFHYFSFESEYDEMRDNNYEEPWVSYTEEVERVNYDMTDEEKIEQLMKVPLTIEATSGSGNFSWTNLGASRTVQYSLNGGEWQTMNTATTVPVTAGDEIQLKGTNTSYSGGGPTLFGVYCNIKGNIMSLVSGDNFASAKTLTDEKVFNSFGRQLEFLSSAKELILPATGVPNSGYRDMFYGCSSLTETPVIFAETCGSYAFCQMFRQTKITKAPELSTITSLGLSCYDSMFYNCQQLKTSMKTLPATSVPHGAYGNMFNGCSQLETIPEFPAEINAGENAFGSMFRDCYSIETVSNFPKVTYTGDSQDGQVFYRMFAGCSGLTSVLPTIDITNAQCGRVCREMFSACTSLVNAPFLPATNVPENGYENMFSGCLSLTSYPVLPATTVNTSSYIEMFLGCSSLVVSPVICATTLGDSCYSGMFSGCTSLTDAQALPCENLVNGCYYHMFAGCSSLTGAPNLPATVVPRNAYYGMFIGCTSLVVPPVLSATTFGQESCEYMFHSCEKLKDTPAMNITGISGVSCFRLAFAYCFSLTGIQITFPNTTVPASGCQFMFAYCTSLVSAMTVLPGTPVGVGAYHCMFSGCTSLKVAPNITATKIEANGCWRMFEGCTSLVTPPIISATTFGGASAMTAMFAGCVSLTDSPVLNAKSLSTGCYNNMFSGCTSLTSVTSANSTKPGTGYTRNWLGGVATGGTFYMTYSGANWDSTITRGVDTVPSDWSIVHSW